MACTGAVYAAGRLWTAAGDRLYGFRATDGTWSCTDRVALGTAVGSLGLRYDGTRLWLADGGGKLYTLTPGQSDVAPTGVTLNQKGVRSFAVAPGGAKVYELAGEQVLAFAADGKALGVVLTLTLPEKAGWWYCAVGVEPRSGDLLVGSYYPDSKVYRFGADGKPVTTGGWPRTSQCAAIVALDGEAWAIEQGGGAYALTTERPALRLGGLGAMYANGVTRDPAGGYWLATSQGLLGFDARGRTTGRRLGGLSGVRCLAIAADGTVIAALEGGQRMIRLALDDAPDAAFTANANEPWRLGAGWSAKAVALAWDNGTFLAPDEAAGQLWRFDPWHTAWGEKPWLKVTEPNAVAAPRAMAVGDVFTSYVAGGKLWEARFDTLDKPREVALPGWSDGDKVVALAAHEDDLLVAAWPDHVTAWKRATDGTFTAAWTKPGYSRVAGLALAGTTLVVSDAGAKRVLLGETAVAMDGAGPVAALGNDVVVADEARKALVRLKLR